MSALTALGSTRQWRRIRAAWADNLALLGTVECWRAEHNRTHPTKVDQSPRCTLTIVNGQRWVLGHKLDRILGGTDNALGYECKPCSDHTGGKTGAKLRTPRRRTRRIW